MIAKLTSILAFLSFSIYSFGQLTVTTGQTAAQMVNNLIGPGITVSNITYTGGANQKGLFNSGGSNIGIPNGIVLAAGNITELVGPAINSADGTIGTVDLSDPDLLTIAQSVTTNPSASQINETHDAATLEFDFIPISNVVTFNFVFGSDEYTTYINTSFNDVFGFFVSGPGISGPYASPAGFPNGAANLALVPNTSLPITISTIHPGLNAQYYVDNTSGTGHTLNGLTTSIPVQFNVQCGETYHFKFAVADCQDNFLSTAVFLAGFNSPPVDLQVQTSTGTDTIVESCNNADVLFIRSTCQAGSGNLTINYSFSGTATDGLDYTTTASPIILPAGQDTAVITLTPIIDALPEGTEEIIITINYLDNNGVNQVLSGNLYISELQPLVIQKTDINRFCYDDSIPLQFNVTGGSGNFTYTWDNSSSTTLFDTVSVLQNGVFYFPFTVVDPCLGNFRDSIRVTMNQTLNIDTLITGPASCDPTGYVSAVISGQTGTPLYNWVGPGPTNPNFINASVWQDLSSGWYYFTITDNVCQLKDSAFVDIENPPSANFSASVTSGCAPLDVTFTNNSQNASTFEWNFGDGTNTTTTNLNDVSHTFNTSATVQLIAIQQANCADTMTLVITVANCGCTDPTATNYDPTATLNDGSCIYPIPIVTAPNVITPNNDNINDVFELSLINVAEVELFILNRWGNVLFKSSSANPIWDGKVAGKESAEGVYFYKYIAKGYNGTEVTGHGFFHIEK
jgi:gliding motility-associated-like protein